MKLQLNDIAKTVITSIESKEFDSAIAWNEKTLKYEAWIIVNGKRLDYNYDEYTKTWKKDIVKLQTKGFEKKWIPTKDEIEEGWAIGTAADCADESKHGHVVMTSLTAEGDGKKLVWDYYKQKTVDYYELSSKPE